MTTTNTYGRQVVIPLTNKSGGGVIAGDVVIVDTSNNDAFTTTTSAAFTGGVGIAQETIANNAVGRVLLSGYAALVNTSASVTRGYYGATHTVAKQAAAQAGRSAGTFCQFLTGGTTPDAVVFPSDLGGAALTNPMTTQGDIIYGGSSGVPTALAAVATGKVLRSAGTGTAPAWGLPPYHGVSAYNSGSTTYAAGAERDMLLDTELYDTDGYHSTSSAQNTFTIPTGLGGKYLITVDCRPNSGGGFYIVGRVSTNIVILAGLATGGATSVHTIAASAVVALADGDVVTFKANSVDGTYIYTYGSNGPGWVSLTLLGA